MKPIKCDLPFAERIEIHPLADFHIGDIHSDFKLIMKKLEHIQNTENAYCILNGDLMDAAIASGGGRKEGGKINRLADLASICDADIFVHSHTHLPVIFKESFFRVNSGNSSVAEVEKLFVNTAASLLYGGYGDAQGYKPSSRSYPVIYLNGLEHEMTAKL